MYTYMWYKAKNRKKSINRKHKKNTTEHIPELIKVTGALLMALEANFIVCMQLTSRAHLKIHVSCWGLITIG